MHNSQLFEANFAKLSGSSHHPIDGSNNTKTLQQFWSNRKSSSFQICTSGMVKCIKNVRVIEFVIDQYGRILGMPCRGCALNVAPFRGQHHAGREHPLTSQVTIRLNAVYLAWSCFYTNQVRFLIALSQCSHCVAHESILSSIWLFRARRQNPTSPWAKDKIWHWIEHLIKQNHLVLFVLSYFCQSCHALWPSQFAFLLVGPFGCVCFLYRSAFLYIYATLNKWMALNSIW